MTLTDWFTYSTSQVRENGASGAKEAAVEAFRSARRRARGLHIFTPSQREVTLERETAIIRQETRTEWDHIQAIRNESPVIKDAMNRTGSEDVVWDVGANIGAWSCFLGTTDASIIAFEPVQANQRALLDNTERNGVEVRVVPRALSDETGDASLRLDSRGTTPGAGRGSLLDSWRGASESTILVPTVRGDELTDLPDPTVLKIDVEGAEPHVLRGMREQLSTVRLAYIEIHDEDDDIVYDILSDAGFSITATVEETGCGVLRAEK